MNKSGNIVQSGIVEKVHVPSLKTYCYVIVVALPDVKKYFLIRKLVVFSKLNISKLVRIFCQNGCIL